MGSSGAEKRSQLLESEMGSSDNANSLWAPGSPRFSFSRDFVQSEVFNPSAISGGDPGDSDFEFGMFALLKSDNTGSLTPMLPAHQLIHNGKLLLPHQSPQSLQEHQAQDDHRESPSVSRPINLPKSPAPCRSWKDMFPLNFKRFASSSASSAMAPSSPETLPLSAASSSLPPPPSLREKTSSKLRFLFRSSSAGSGTRDQSLDPQPSLGRSASESNVSSSSSDPFQLPDRNAAIELLRSRAAAAPISVSAAHRRTGSTADAHTGQIASDTWKIPRERVRHRSFHGRPVLAEVKMSRAASPNNNNVVQNGSIHKNTSGKQKCCSIAINNTTTNTKRVSASSNTRKSSTSSPNAWRAYMSTGNRNTGNLKVAEVLHMEVCMGQSSISKAFSMRKENELQPPKLHSTNNNNKPSVRSSRCSLGNLVSVD